MLKEVYTNQPIFINSAGGVKLGENIFIGGGTYVNPNISICSNVIVGSGSLVIYDIHEPGTYIGSPVKKIK